MKNFKNVIKFQLHFSILAWQHTNIDQLISANMPAGLCAHNKTNNFILNDLKKHKNAGDL